VVADAPPCGQQFLLISDMWYSMRFRIFVSPSEIPFGLVVLLRLACQGLFCSGLTPLCPLVSPAVADDPPTTPSAVYVVGRTIMDTFAGLADLPDSNFFQVSLPICAYL